MGIWYILAVALGTVLYIKNTFFNKKMEWRTALSAQLALVGAGLAAFGAFMLTPAAVKLVDLLFG